MVKVCQWWWTKGDGYLSTPFLTNLKTLLGWGCDQSRNESPFFQKETKLTFKTGNPIRFQCLTKYEDLNLVFHETKL